jgi:hypothetical protein
MTNELINLIELVYKSDMEATESAYLDFILDELNKTCFMED